MTLTVALVKGVHHSGWRESGYGHLNDPHLSWLGGGGAWGGAWGRSTLYPQPTPHALLHVRRQLQVKHRIINHQLYQNNISYL